MLKDPRYRWLALPGVLYILILLIIPLQALVLLSFAKSNRFDLIYDFNLSSYSDVLTYPYLKFLFRSICIAAVVAFLAVLIAWPAAFYIHRYGKRRTLLLFSTALPFFSGMILRLISLQQILQPAGFLELFLQWLGISTPPGLMYSDVGTIIGLLYLWLPFAVLLIYISLSTYPFDLERVALVSGASSFSIVRNVVLPMNRQGTLAAILVVFLPTLASSTEAQYLGGPGGELFGNIIRRQIETGTWPRGASLLIILLVTSLLALATAWQSLRRRIFVDDATERASLQISETPLPIFKRSSLALFIAVIFFLYVPILVLFFSSISRRPNFPFPPSITFHWFGSAFENEILVEALGNSLRLAVAVGILATLMAGLAAFGIERSKPGSDAQLINFVFIFPFVVTPLVIGISAKLFFRLIVEQNSGISPAVLSNTVYCLAFSFVVLRLRFSQHDWRFEALASTMSASSWKTLLRVTLPQIWPALLGSFLISALMAFNSYQISFFTLGAVPTLPTLVGGMLRNGLSEDTYALTAVVLLAALLLGVVALAGVRFGARDRIVGEEDKEQDRA